MPTSFSSPKVADVLCEFAVGLARAARVFTVRQLSRHPEVSWRSQPERRSREFLLPYRDKFDVLPWLDGKPFLWRLTNEEKRRRGYAYRNVGATQHTEHWLAIGDTWMELVFSGNRPSQWFTEGKAIGGFDVYCVIRNQPYLIEVQRTPLSPRQWISKWNRRAEWLRQRQWMNEEWSKQFSNVKPKVALVCETTEVAKGVEYGKTVPNGVILIPRMNDVKRMVK